MGFMRAVGRVGATHKNIEAPLTSHSYDTREGIVSHA